jgi:hypothetical protein
MADVKSAVITWVEETVEGAAAELKTVLYNLEQVYKDKLSQFKITQGTESPPTDTGGEQASPVVPPVAASGNGDTTEASPVDPTIPQGNTVDVNSGTVTDPTGTTVPPEPTAPEPTEPTVTEPTESTDTEPTTETESS